MRIAGIILSLLCAFWALPVQAAPASDIVCKNTRHCLDILERHLPDEFDYDVLHSEFLRLGPKAQERLLIWTAGDHPVKSVRARHILKRGGFEYSPADIAILARSWPGPDVDISTEILRPVRTAVIRNRLIETLSHENQAVRSWSRSLLKKMPRDIIRHPVREADFDRLAQALRTEPDAILVELMAQFPISRTRPVLRDVLEADDPSAMSAAYQALFDDNPKAAFNDLIGVLKQLENRDTAFAIAQMLKQRHETRVDGFYLRFARDLAEDETFSIIGRVAGLTAVLNQEPHKEVPLFSKPEALGPVIAAAVSGENGFSAYFLQNWVKQAQSHKTVWINAFWSGIAEKNLFIKGRFLHSIGDHQASMPQTVLIDALNENRDWRMQAEAARYAGLQRSQIYNNRLTELSQHPVSRVRISALSALDKIENGSSARHPDDWKAQVLNETVHCLVDETDYRAAVQYFPFFEVKVNYTWKQWRIRNLISSAAPTKKGWLAGFSVGEWGGDIRYYDNQSGDETSLNEQLMNEHKHYSVDAILPVNPPKLGEYADRFWIIMSNGGFDDDGAIYKLSVNGDEINLDFIAQLPHRFISINQEESGDVLMGFHQKGEVTPPLINPPLRLAPNGQISLACQSQNTAAQLLP